MNYKDILDNGRLIYSTIPSDIKVRDWILNSVQLEVSYYTTAKLSAIDKLICGLLINAGGKLEKQELGLILGFDIASTEHHGQTFYTDKAEVDMYQRLLGTLVEWNLVVIETQSLDYEEPELDDNEENENKEKSEIKNVETIRITAVGRRAMEMEVKFSFHLADVIYYSNWFTTGDKSTDLQFPYFQELNIKAQIESTEIDSIDPDSIDFDYESEWKERLLLQMDPSWTGVIYNIVPQDKTLPLSHEYLDFKLFHFENGYKLLAYKNDVLCPAVTELINSERNSQALNNRIKKCYYYKLFNDKSTSYTFNEVIMFWDCLECEEYNLLFEGNRIDWTDSKLFELIVASEFCTSHTWDKISKICPTEVIKMLLEKHSEHFNWQILSNRMDVNYILTYYTYPWYFENILGRADIQKEDAQKIFILPTTKDIDWDWEIVEKFLSFEFVKNNINELNIDFYHLTSWLKTDELSIIFENPDKAWDWDGATKKFSLKQIAENISLVGSYINNYYLIDLCFENENNIIYTLSSEVLKRHFAGVVSEGKFANFSLKDRPNYVWNDQTISFMENIGLLNWVSKQYEKGFPQYAFVKWNSEFFAKYYQKLISEEDRAYVSHVIEDYSLVTRYPNFAWDWKSLSSNIHLANNDDFITAYRDKIVLATWVNSANSRIVEKYFDFLHLEKALLDQDAVGLISFKVSKEYIKLHPDLDWEHCAFTNAMGDAIDTSQIVKYYAHWDWNTLSDMVTPSMVLEHLEFPWRSDVLSESICLSPEAVSLINAHQQRLDWGVVSENILFSDFQIVAETYNDKWNREIINNRFASDFNKELVTNESLQEIIDWEDVSENASVDTLAALIVEQPEQINWEIVTERLCPTLTIEKLLDVADLKKWDWNYLSNNLDINVIIAGLDNSQLEWDWKIVTERLSADFILVNLDKYQDLWDWSTIWNSKLDYDFAINKIQKIAEAINLLNDNSKDAQWSDFTRVLCKDNVLNLTEHYLPSDGYHWDYTYVYEEVEDIEKFVSQPHAYIDWSALSESEAANKYFHYDQELFDARIWKVMAKKRLEDPRFNWDYKSLTKLENIQKGYQVFFKIHTESWDWNYISAEGYCLMVQNNGEANLRKYKDYVDFAILSKREDIGLSSTMLQSFIDEKWNWQDLSSNESISTNIGFVFEYKDKNWDWSAVSKNRSIKWEKESNLREIFKYEPLVNSFDWEAFVSRTDIKFNKEFVSIIHKYIVGFWSILTANKNFVPDVKTLNIAKRDGVDIDTLNWNIISGSKRLIPMKKDNKGQVFPDLSFVKEYAEHLDWKIVTRNQFFDIYNDSVVNEYKDFLDWTFISNELENDKLSLDYLCTFKKYLDWTVVNNKIDYRKITEKYLKALEDYLDWKKVSDLNLNFSVNLVEEYSGKWYWNILSRNNSFREKCSEEDKAHFKSQLNVASFMDNFESSAKIYHFTHLFNVIEVLKSRKILSRNRAQELGLLKFDSAGGVVSRTSKAHSFARFYFRPNTPTQFYNECLGWDSEMITSWGKSYYSNALNLGLPKCPIPVFLEFDLSEVVSHIPHNCYYSDGNMQTNAARVYKVEEQPNSIHMDYLYNDMGDAFYMAKRNGGFDRGAFCTFLNSIKEQSQQEFLIKDEFDFSDIKSLKIHCYDEETASMLRTYLGDDPIKEHIVIGGCFSYKNRDLTFNFNEDELSIQSNYNSQAAYFLVKGLANIANLSEVKRQTSEGIIMYPRVVLKHNEGSDFEVHFVDKNARTTDWLIYKTI